MLSFLMLLVMLAFTLAVILISRFADKHGIRLFVPFGMQFDADTEKSLKALSEKQKALGELIETSLSTLKNEIKKIGDGTAETKQVIEKQVTDFGKIADEARNIARQAIEKAQQLDVVVQKLGTMGMSATEAKTIGQLFVESEVYKTMVQKNATKSDPFFVKSLFSRKTAIVGDVTGANATGQPLVAHASLRVPGIIYEPEQYLSMRDLLNAVTTTAAVIEFVREKEYTSAADFVSENPNAKPEATLKFELDSAKATTLAHWIPASRQVLADAPALRSHIDTRLIYGLRLKENQNILYGTGTNNQLEGITINAAAYNQGYPSGSTKIDTLRRAILQAQLANYPVTGIVMHPSDWASIELIKDSQNRYIIGDPNTLLGPRIWGVPVVADQSVTQDDFIVGAFGIASQLYDVEQANIRVSESHANFFIQNMVAILAEERLILVNYRPKALVYGQFTPAP
jgi:HK97 family phage major capsid protein